MITYHTALYWKCSSKGETPTSARGAAGSHPERSILFIFDAPRNLDNVRYPSAYHASLQDFPFPFCIPPAVPRRKCSTAITLQHPPEGMHEVRVAWRDKWGIRGEEAHRAIVREQRIKVLGWMDGPLACRLDKVEGATCDLHLTPRARHAHHWVHKPKYMQGPRTRPTSPMPLPASAHRNRNH